MPSSRPTRSAAPPSPDAARARRGAAASGLVGLDWGTSSLRAYRFAADGAMLERRERALGISAIADGRFRAAFESVCADWLRDAPGVAVIACGMIGSRQGWREASYLPAPAGLPEIAGRLLRIDDDAGRRFAIVPGVRTEHGDGVHDVMRGEETQVFGAHAAGLGAPADEAVAGAKRAPDAGAAVARFVLPGTHSKWVGVRAGRIERFRTYLTGEMFAVLSQHSILGRLFPAPERPSGVASARAPRRGEDAGADPGASAGASAGTGAQATGFDLGVRRAAADPGGLAALLFSVRSEGLLGSLPPDALPAYLSGLLIGAEVAHALGRESTAASGADPITIIANERLAARYRRALGLLGAPARTAPGEPAARGLFSIARAAGLIG